MKSILEIDPADTSEDKKLLFLVEWASAWIEEVLGRPLAYKTRTDYYQGSGTQKLQLRARPVYASPPAPYGALAVVVDEGGNFGAASGAFQGPGAIPLVYGQDYTLRIDQADGGSRSGLLIRIGNYWPRPMVRQTGLLSPFVGDDTGSVQVTYTAGYTQDTLPAQLRAAVNLLVARMRYILPLGVELGSESYEDRSISVITSEKQGLLALVNPLIMSFRNWHF